MHKPNRECGSHFALRNTWDEVYPGDAFVGGDKLYLGLFSRVVIWGFTWARLTQGLTLEKFVSLEFTMGDGFPDGISWSRGLYASIFGHVVAYGLWTRLLLHNKLYTSQNPDTTWFKTVTAWHLEN